VKSVELRIFRITVERGGMNMPLQNPLPIETVPLKNIERKVKTKEEVKKIKRNSMSTQEGVINTGTRKHTW
jgi:hypothetical protein